MNTGYPYDVAVLIGRFQPFHLGHAALLAKALENAPKVVVVLGSSLRSRSAKNPFSWEERAAMISRTVDPKAAVRLRFVPMRDYYDAQRWAQAVSQALERESVPGDRITLIGHVKDASSYYLGLFPDWAYQAAGLQGDYNATHIRRLLFESESPDAQWAAFVPPAVHHCLLGWKGSPEFAELRKEHLAIEESKQIWGAGPFVTLDALVTAADHVLLVRRGQFPGKGLWAIPGGFLEAQERLYEGALRELQEETTLDLRDPALGCAFKGATVFDHPDRSQRGRVITHVHYFTLACRALPTVEGADDAAEARWLQVSSLPVMEDQCFEDHFHILETLLFGRA